MRKYTGLAIVAHGKESGPTGLKITVLTQVASRYKIPVIAPDFRGIYDPEQRVKLLLEQVGSYKGPLFLAGSSMGGYVAIRASQVLRPAGLLLMSPAIGITGYPDQELLPGCSNISLVHAWHDDVIPYANVIQWAEKHQAELYLMNDDHRLGQQLDLLQFLFETQIQQAGFRLQ